MRILMIVGLMLIVVGANRARAETDVEKALTLIRKAESANYNYARVPRGPADNHQRARLSLPPRVLPREDARRRRHGSGRKVGMPS
jgi:hypothetical protein